MEKPSREWLIHNAICSWLYVVKDVDHPWRPLYQELENEFNPHTKTRKRGRPAKRQRTQKATSNPSSTKENQTVNQEA